MDEYEYDDGPLYAPSFGDWERGGSRLAGSKSGKFDRTQQYVHRSSLTPVERFIEDAQRFCDEAGFRFADDVYERIARGHPRPGYLSPKACVLVVTKVLTIAEWKRNFNSFVGIAGDHGLKPADLYRYALMIETLLR